MSAWNLLFSRSFFPKAGRPLCGLCLAKPGKSALPILPAPTDDARADAMHGEAVRCPGHPVLPANAELVLGNPPAAAIPGCGLPIEDGKLRISADVAIL